MSGESPSPFVLAAPLMPPWVQTEWLRLTGTIEKRSTPIPLSAARIAVMSPARPPPTMMIRGSLTRTSSTVRREPLAGVSPRFLGSRLTAHDSRLRLPSYPERLDAPDADIGENEKDGGRDVQHAALRLRSDGQPPHDRERPDAVGQVERGRENAGKVEGVDPRVRDRGLHLAEEVEALVVLELDEPRRPEMEEDEGEHDDAGDALDEVHPVAHVGVGDHVWLRR